MYPVIAFQLLFAGLPCIQPVITLLAAVQCKFHNAVILTISRHKLNGTFHQLFYVAFTESHGAHDSIEYLAKDPVMVMRYLRILPCGLGGHIWVARIELTKYHAAHLRPDPLSVWVIEAAAFRRHYSATKISQSHILGGPAKADPGQPFVCYVVV